MDLFAIVTKQNIFDNPNTRLYVYPDAFDIYTDSLKSLEDLVANSESTPANGLAMHDFLSGKWICVNETTLDKEWLPEDVCAFSNTNTSEQLSLSERDVLHDATKFVFSTFTKHMYEFSENMTLEECLISPRHIDDANKAIVFDVVFPLNQPIEQSVSFATNIPSIQISKGDRRIKMTFSDEKWMHMTL